MCGWKVGGYCYKNVILYLKKKSDTWPYDNEALWLKASSSLWCMGTSWKTIGVQLIISCSLWGLVALCRIDFEWWQRSRLLFGTLHCECLDAGRSRRSVMGEAVQSLSPAATCSGWSQTNYWGQGAAADGLVGSQHSSLKMWWNSVGLCLGSQLHLTLPRGFCVVSMSPFLLWG